MTKVVNLFAGPGSGKSTMASGLFYHLKTNGYVAELAHEFAKDLTWENRQLALSNQVYLFGKQYHKLFRLKDKVDFIITDSPLALCLVYGKYEPFKFHDCVLEYHRKFNNLNVFIQRVKPYSEAGRSQTLDEAREIDKEILLMLDHYDIPYITVRGDAGGIDQILDMVVYGNYENR